MMLPADEAKRAFSPGERRWRSASFVRRKAKRASVALGLAVVAAACASEGSSGAPAGLTITISGEGTALTGIAFPPASANDLAFVDGWDVRFERILVTVDQITLSDAPDTNPTDQAVTGAVLATARGPWAVDLTKPGAAPSGSADPSDGSGADGRGGAAMRAQTLARFDALDGGGRFDPARRYAFGFEFAPASSEAARTNLDAAAEADYADMVSQGISVLYVGTATFAGGSGCTSSDPSYDFDALPKTVAFRFGFRTPTIYKNCQNSDLHGKPFDGEESPRGVQVREGSKTVAQITLHVDHPFWNTVDHGAAELFFDQMAAVAPASGPLTLDALSTLDFTSFTDAAGRALPWRSCLADKPVQAGVRRFDAGSVPIDPSAAPALALRGYADFVAYQQSTQGHLNADGLCAVERRFPAPR